MMTVDPKLVEAVADAIKAAAQSDSGSSWPDEALAAIAVCTEYLAGECEARADEIASNWSQNKRPEEYYAVRRTIDILKAQANRIRELGGVGGGG